MDLFHLHILSGAFYATIKLDPGSIHKRLGLASWTDDIFVFALFFVPVQTDVKAVKVNLQLSFFLYFYSPADPLTFSRS